MPTQLCLMSTQRKRENLALAFTSSQFQVIIETLRPPQNRHTPRMLLRLPVCQLKLFLLRIYIRDEASGQYWSMNCLWNATKSAIILVMASSGGKMVTRRWKEPGFCPKAEPAAIKRTERDGSWRKYQFKKGSNRDSGKASTWEQNVERVKVW